MLGARKLVRQLSRARSTSLKLVLPGSRTASRPATSSVKAAAIRGDPLQAGSLDNTATHSEYWNRQQNHKADDADHGQRYDREDGEDPLGARYQQDSDAIRALRSKIARPRSQREQLAPKAGLQTTQSQDPPGADERVETGSLTGLGGPVIEDAHHPLRAKSIPLMTLKIMAKLQSAGLNCVSFVGRLSITSDSSCVGNFLIAVL